MLSKNFSKKLHLISVAMAASTAMTGCSLIHEDIPACPAQLKVRFVYDCNLKFADAFAHEVKSVNVWAFDSTGAPVWSGSASGEALGEDGFELVTPLLEGTYDFISWCGLEGNDDCTLQNYTPASKEELELRLNTISEDGLNVINTRIPGFFHGSTTDVGFEVDPGNPTYKTVTIPLMKDSKDIRIMLQHIDGSAIDNRDFTVTITDANSWMAWNNNIIPGCPTVSYRPWNIKYGQVTAPRATSRDITSVSSLLFELSTGRLMENSGAMLTIHRNWDDRDVIRIPLIEFLLLVKGHYGDLTDQEYLDRQDDYSIVFFIDQHSNWYEAAGIFINDWAVVPPQSEDF